MSPGTSLPELRTRAYAAYLLTRQMTVTTPMLTSIRQTLDSRYPKQWQSDLVGAYLAAAYHLQKQERIATDLMDKQVELLLKRDTSFGYEYYYDPLIRDAQRLYILARHFPSRAKGLPPTVMQNMIKPIAEGQFNTLSSAYLILGLDAYANAVGPEVAGKLSIAEIDMNGKKTPITLPNNLIPRVPFTAGTAKLRFGGDANITSYYAVTETGFDRTVPTTEIRNGIEILREYVGNDGKPLTSIQVGDEVTVRLRFRAINRSHISNVALIDLMPGGFEPVLEPAAPPQEDNSANNGEQQNPANNTALTGLAGATSTFNIEYADVREDRVVFYGGVSQDFSQVTYRIKATNSGRFIVPPAYTEAMYERNVQARSSSNQSLTVLPPSTQK